VELRTDDPAAQSLSPVGVVESVKLSQVADRYLAMNGGKPGGRVIFVGDAASGKTVLTLFMQLGLLDHRAANGGPVPFILQLSSWNPEEDSFRDWAAGRLRETAPELGGLVRIGDETLTKAARLIEQHKVILILDAMDEMPKGFMRKAFGLINEKCGSDWPLVVTCRTKDYLESLDSRVGGGRGESHELTDAIVIELQSTDVGAVNEYLLASSPRSDLRLAWQPVLEHLKTDPKGPLAQALKSPLAVWVAARTYRDAPEPLAERLRTEPFRSSEEVEEHLLGGLVPAVFSQAAATTNLRFRWKAAEAEKWLRFLASWVKDREDAELQAAAAGKGTAESGRDIAWWQLVGAPEARRFCRIGAGVIGGLATGAAVGLGWGCVFWSLLGHRDTVLSSLAIGLFCTVAMGRECAVKSPPPASKSFALPPGRDLGAPVVVGLTIMAVSIVGAFIMTESATAILWALVIAAPVTVSYAFATPFVDISKVSSPRALYRSDLTQSAMYCAAYSVSIGLFTGVRRGWMVGVAMGVASGLSGGFNYGLFYRLAFKENIPGMVAWLRFRLAHFRLACAGVLPWRLFAFLEDAHRLGVLRQSGATYQFSHSKVRDRLAERRSTPLSQEAQADPAQRPELVAAE
jgi:hypothetical protein